MDIDSNRDPEKDIESALKQALVYMKEDSPYEAGILLYGAYRLSMMLHGIPGDEIGVAWMMVGKPEDIVVADFREISARVQRATMTPSLNFTAYFNGVSNESIEGALDVGERTLEAIHEYVADWIDGSPNPEVAGLRNVAFGFARMCMAAASFIGMWSTWIDGAESPKVKGSKPAEPMIDTSPFQLMSFTESVGLCMQGNEHMLTHAVSILNFAQTLKDEDREIDISDIIPMDFIQELMRRKKENEEDE